MTWPSWAFPNLVGLIEGHFLFGGLESNFVFSYGLNCITFIITEAGHFLFLVQRVGTDI